LWFTTGKRPFMTTLALNQGHNPSTLEPLRRLTRHKRMTSVCDGFRRVANLQSALLLRLASSRSILVASGFFWERNSHYCDRIIITVCPLGAFDPMAV